jgi:hypothetical protein
MMENRYLTIVFRSFSVILMALASAGSFAASVEFIRIEKTILVPQRPPGEILPYSIILESSGKPIKKGNFQNITLKNNLTYLTRVKVDRKTYYRLVTGNFKSARQARQSLNGIIKFFPNAWINLRSRKERQELARLIKPDKKNRSAKKSAAPEKITRRKSVAVWLPLDKLLEQAKQEFLNKNYSRVLSICERLIKTGNLEQNQHAMELKGIVKERQNQFAEAIAIYQDFLILYPDSDMSSRIQSRLTGLETMIMEPKRNIEPLRRPGDSDWTIHGAFSQYYREITIQSDNDQDIDIVHSALATDVELLAKRKTDSSTMVLLFDGGIYRLIEEEENDSRISQALIKYTDNHRGYQLTGGRQRGTAKGVYSRFEGFVYKGMPNPGFNYSVYFGTPVPSSYDKARTDYQFAGTSFHFSPFSKAEMDIYLLQQNVSDLTDRQAIGTEFVYRHGDSYLFNLIDYDLFYEELNSLTLTGSFPYNEKLSFYLSYDFHHSPLLATGNALAGQTVSSIDELKGLFSDDEIYQLAQDRTSQGHNFNLASHYQLDLSRQLYLSFSYASLEKTIASAGVAENPATEYLDLAADYSIRGYFFSDDSTSFGLRLSGTESTHIASLRARSYIRGSNNMGYDSRIRLDFRENKDSGEEQWVLKPSIKLTYRPARRHSFEGSMGIKYFISDSSLNDDQTTYDLLLGYLYRF